MHGYKQINHTADIAIEIYADKIENLFLAGAEAWLDISISGKDFNPDDSIQLEIEGASYEELLIEFIGELNFMLHVKEWLFCSINKIELATNGAVYFLKTEISGERINLDKFYVREEIKAVTFHQVEIEKKDDLFTTRIVFDI